MFICDEPERLTDCDPFEESDAEERAEHERFERAIRYMDEWVVVGLELELGGVGMATHLDHLTSSLAREFCAELHAVLTPHEIAVAVYRNKMDGPISDVCHTHDFCDPNQCILDVFERHGIDCDKLLGDYTELMDAVWTMAKKADFAL